MEYSFCLFSLVFIACFGKGIMITLSVCDERAVTLSCPDNNTVILLQDVTNGDSSCKTVYNSNSCFTIMQNNCNGKNICILYLNDLSLKGCKRPQRYMKISYQCSSWLNRYELSTTTCADKLSSISCLKYNLKWLLMYYTIKIKDASFLENLNICSDCGSSNAKLLLAQLCDHQETCQNPSVDVSCLYRPTTVNYICQDSASLTYYVTTTKSNTTLVPTTDIVQNSNSSSLTYPVTTTKSNITLETATVPVETQVYLKLDHEGRVLLSGDMFGNVTVMLCGEGWDDQDAQVVCRYKENSTGEATVVKGVTDYETVPVVIQCKGNEKNPFECNHSLMAKCNVSTVAAVSCCKDSSESRRGCQIGKVKQQSPPESTNDIAIGLSVSLSVVTVIAVVVLVIKLRRSSPCKREKTVSSIINKSEDYVGNQGISLPNLDKKSKNLTDTNTECYSKRVIKHDERRPETSNTKSISPNISSHSSGTTTSIEAALEYGRYECDKSIGNVQNSASEDTYACSEDGAYDKVNTNRHLPIDSNVYCHSIDTMYDILDCNSNNERTTVTYDHFIGLKSDDNYDLAIRK